MVVVMQREVKKDGVEIRSEVKRMEWRCGVKKDGVEMQSEVK